MKGSTTFCDRCNAKLPRDHETSIDYYEPPHVKPYTIADAHREGFYNLCPACEDSLAQWFEQNPDLVAFRMEDQEAELLLSEYEETLQDENPEWCMDSTGFELVSVIDAERERIGKKQPRKVSLIDFVNGEIASAKIWVEKQRSRSNRK